MPKTKVQELIFTGMMVLVMVYAMICYNVALNCGGMANHVFLDALRELPVMAVLAFLLDFFLVGKVAKRAALKIVNPEKDNPFLLVLGISAVSVVCMCPLMSLAATVLFQHPGAQVIAVWIETTVKNFPMALCWQLFAAGPLVRLLFRLGMKQAKGCQPAADTVK